MKVNNIYNGDCRDLLKQLEDDSIDCCISSPPYLNLRDYGIEPSIWDGDPECEHEWDIQIKKGTSGGKKSEKVQVKDEENFQIVLDSEYSFCSKCGAWKGCLGLEPTFELYIQHLADIYDLVQQKLKKEGTCWVNLGDTYGNSSAAGNKVFGNPEFNKNRPSRELTKTPKKEVNKKYEKCLLMIPQRFAIEMISRGWILRNVLIWHKPNCMPSSVKDRFTVDFEYVYFFVKSKKYWFEQQREKNDKPKSGWVKQREKGINTNKYETPYSQWKEDDRDPIQGRNKRCVWTIPTKPNKEAHFATFNPALVTPMIKSGCPIDGIVLDPFAGIGTTLQTAWNLGRNYIGFEISEEYCKIANKLLQKTKFKRLDGF
jgi:site-specific DNA-methyltransferase (adenine-specific)